MLTVKSIMTTDVFTVTPETPVLETIKIIIDKHISGLPVINEHKKLVGVITEKDLLRVLVEGQAGKGKKVKDFMTKNVVSFDADENVVVVCEYFLNNVVRRVPIVEKGALVGVVSRRDILKLVLADKGL